MKYNGVVKICLYCKRKFKVIRARKNTANFCSKSCADKSKIGKPSPKYNPIIKKCEFCGKKFKTIKTNKHRAKFCSLKCKHLGSRGKKPWNYDQIEIKCINCNKKFKVSKYRKSQAQFCSKKCKWDYGRIKRICKVCGKHFITTKSTYKKFNRPYCSIDCYNKKRCVKEKKRKLFLIDKIRRFLKL